MTRTFALYGPPGTGKTTAGTTLARSWFDAGARPEEVAYLAFTKAAARAACTKILSSEEEVDPDSMTDRFPLFRTIHSLAYRGLKVARPDVKVLTTSDMKKFSQQMGYVAAFAVHSWEDLAEVYQVTNDSGKSHWDRALSAYALTRITASTTADLDEARSRPSRTANLAVGFLEEDVYRVFVAKYEAFKQAEGLIDFTDMLEFALRSMPPMDGARYVIVDEAQDLCAIHHAIIDRLFRSAEEVWFIGDDDQAIYKFSGASAELFLQRTRRADRQIVLRQTHRFGQSVVDFSAKIIRRVKDRVEKDIIGVSGRSSLISGSGQFVPAHMDALILHRHVAGCQEAAKLYMDAGLPFRNERGKDPLGAKNRIKAWRGLDYLADGKYAPAGFVKLLVEELMPSTVLTDEGKNLRLVVHGGKKKVESALIPSINLEGLKTFGVLTDDGISAIRRRDYPLFKHSADLEYYGRVVKNGHDLDSRGAVITTIHGSKGRQAGEVVVFNEMSRRCWTDPETEHRLAYVAATRTRGLLTICALSMVDWAAESYDYPMGRG